MQVLLTGGAGFIGSQIARTLLKAGHRLRVLDKLTYAGHRRHLDGLRLDAFLEGDVCDPPTVAEAVQGCDAVIHAAAESHVARALVSPREFVQTNIEGTRVLLDAACQAGVPRFLFLSTDEVFGAAPPDRAFLPTDPIRPGNVYAASKAGAEAMLHAWRHSHGYPASLLRCTNNYGPRQHPEKAVPWWIGAALAGAPVPVQGDGMAVRDWLFVEDFARGVLAALEHPAPGRVWHFAGRQPRHNRDIAGQILALCGRAPTDLQHIAERQGQDARYALDDTETRATLGWAPQVPLAVGLQKTLDWYQEHPWPWS